MPLRDPQELLKRLDEISRAIGSNETLDGTQRRRMWEDLSDIYNLLSALLRKPSMAQVLHTVSASEARRREQLAQERVTLEAHRQFVEESFEKADQYLRTIQAGGYAIFFTVWGFTHQWLDPEWATLAASLMLISATVFVFWEITKFTLLVLVLKRHASISSAVLEEFVRSRMSKLLPERAVLVWLTKSRVWVWLACVLTAIPSVGILLINLILGFWRGL